MANKETVFQEPNKFSKSVGAGMKSLFRSGGRNYYVLEYKVASEKHRAGEKQEIIIDYIELGRDSNCQVNFGNTFPTVSRRHASITRDGKNWVLKQLSATNPTLINDRPIAKQWYLQNGDEIKLSVEGPKLGFLLPANPTVGSIGFTRRLSLFRQQALKPYKQAITVLSFVFIAAIGILSFLIYTLKGELNLTKSNYDQAVKINKQSTDSLFAENQKNKTIIAGLEKKVKEVDKKVTGTISGKTGGITSVDTLGEKAIIKQLSCFEKNIYFVLTNKIVVDYNGKREETDQFRWSGTGFLLSDGRLITARHVIEPWFFFDETNNSIIELNLLANNGASVKAYFTAYSPDGSKFDFCSDKFLTDRSSDEKKEVTDNNGNRLIISDAPLNNGKDWASYHMDVPGSIIFDNQLSQSLQKGDDIYVLGYPFGLSLQGNSLQTMFSKSEVGQNGLVNGMINITSRGFDHGNSGGPAFCIKNNQVYEIGIISASIGAIGNIVPIVSAK